MATCIVSGTFLNPQGSAVSGATVRFNIESPILDLLGNLLMPKEITTTTATDGTWSLAIIQGVAGSLTLDLNPTTTSPVVKYNFSLIIPATTTATFATCWVESASFGGQTVSTSLTFSNISGQATLAQLPSLPSADLWIGDGTSTAAPVAMSGDATISNLGVVTVGSVGTSTAANIHAAELLANAATSANTVSAIVKRDSSGNFSAGTITAALTGNATTSTSATNFSGSLSGDVTGLQTATHVVGIQGVSVANTTPTDAQSLIYNSSQTKYNPISLSGDVTLANTGAATVASVGGSTAAAVHTSELATSAATSANTASTIVKRDSAGNFSAGTVTASQVIDSGLTASTVPYADSSKQLTSSAVTPTELGYLSGVTSALQTQINNLAAGIVFKAACDYATTAALPTVIYANGSSGVGATITGFAFGALSVDSASPSVGKRILVKNQASHLQNGIYTVTATGGGAAVFILTRSTDFDQSVEMDEGSSTLIMSGTVNSDTVWSMTSTVPITVGTDSIDFVQIAGPGTVTAGTNITVTGNQVAVTALTSGAVYSTGSALTSESNLAVSRGGTGAGTFTAHGVLLGNGSSLLQTTAVGATGTVLHGNSGADPTYSAVALTADVSGVLPESNGGTNQSTFALGDTLYSSAANTLSKLAGNTTSTKKFLTQTGTGSVSAAPSWGTIASGDVPTLNQNTTGTASNVTGTVAVANGGTAQTTYTDGQLLIGNSSGNTLTKATLTAGSNVTITNGNGSISIAATSGSGATATYWSGYFANPMAWDRSNAAFGDPTISSGSNTLTTRKSSGLTVTAAASNLCGVTFTPATSTAVYLITACFKSITNVSAIVGSYRLYDGTTEITTAETQSGTSGTSISGFSVTLTGIYAPASTSAQTVKIQTAGGGGSLIEIGALNGVAQAVDWTITQIVS
jgi:hypothetical protein